MSQVKKVLQILCPLRVAAEAGARLSTPFGFNCGQSYLATLVTPQNCTKRLRNLTFVVQFAYFSIRPNKGREQQKRNLCFFEQLLTNFRATFEQSFEKLRETF